MADSDDTGRGAAPADVEALSLLSLTMQADALRRENEALRAELEGVRAAHALLLDEHEALIDLYVLRAPTGQSLKWGAEQQALSTYGVRSRKVLMYYTLASLDGFIGPPAPGVSMASRLRREMARWVHVLTLAKEHRPLGNDRDTIEQALERVLDSHEINKLAREVRKALF